MEVDPDHAWETKVVNSGKSLEASGSTGEINAPICTSTTFEQRGPGIPTGRYEYSRSGNPTRDPLEHALALLEEASYALAFSSGLGAMTAVLSILSMSSETRSENGSRHVICSHDVYGGTARLLNTLGKDMYGIETYYHDFSQDPEGFMESMRQNHTKLLWLETVSNPTLQIIDLIRVIKAARSIDPSIVIVVDNTFLTPVVQRPLHLSRYNMKSGPDEEGHLAADIVVHSVTKYINGHSDVVMGALMTNNQLLYEKLKFAQNALGIVPSPFDCYLVMRGIKTLSVRFHKQCQNAEKVAYFLSQHARVKRVHYPGLPQHPNHLILKQQQEPSMDDHRLFGAMVSLELNCNADQVSSIFLKQLRCFLLAESLGGVESLVDVPSLMTHRGLSAEVKAALGITNQFVRLSVGIEDASDLVGDLDQALSKLDSKV